MKHSSQIILACLAATAANAQSLKARPLGPITSISKETVGIINGLRQLPDGSVIVNDLGRRRLIMLDASLQGTVVLADTAAGSANMYAQSGGTLLPYVGDSSLFLDLAAQSFVVIDPKGKIVRVMSVPRSNDMFALMTGSPGFDAQGRMVYRTSYPRAMLRTADGGIQSAPAPDSQPVIRVSLDTRKADTIGAVRVAKPTMIAQTMSNGGTIQRQVSPPFPLVDDYAVLENGAVALLRGQDYHVDWIMPDGKKSTTGKVAFDWRRLSDDDKIAMVDSITNARNNPSAGPVMGGGPVMMFGDGGGGGASFRMGGDAGGGGRGATQMVMGGAPVPAPTASAAPAAASSGAATSATSATTSATPANASANGSAASSANSNGPANSANAASANAASTVTSKSAPAGSPVAAQAVSDARQAAAATPPGAAGRAGTEMDKVAAMVGPMGMGSLPPLPTPAAADLPDYLPPFRVNQIRPDRDANFWVPTSLTASAPGNVIYDVIDSKGELADRIEIPKGYAIIGFGKGGIIYMTHRENAALKVVSAKR